MTAKLRFIRPLLIATSVVLALLPTAAIASTTYYEKVAGIETGVPVPCAVNGDSLSSFAGVAFGTLNGTFAAAICHTPLGSTVGSTAYIVGGAFALSNGVTGTFTAGTVTMSGPTLVFGSICVQNYTVAGTLSNGTFGGKLTHYGFEVGSTCNVVFATVAGKATITP